MEQKIIIATRGSRLAIRQSEIIKEILLRNFHGITVDFLEVVTQGDIDQQTPLSSFGNTGVFIKGLEEKLLNSEADLAVHSLKDVPSTIHPDLLLGSFPEREDARDVLVTKTGGNWRDLKPGSVMGTSSPARMEQMKLLRSDLIFKDIRGNVDTRVKKVLNGEYDATILAAAGLKRLGYKITDESYFTFDEIIPSPGQGALVVQIHKNRKEIFEMIRLINDKKTEILVNAERAFMAEIGGGCRFPVAAHAEVYGNDIIFRGMAFKPGFKKIETVKIITSENELLERAKQEARQIISKYN
jgi:hydroxymethylbilane synthase